jgi:hypothetical protein
LEEGTFCIEPSKLDSSSLYKLLQESFSNTNNRVCLKKYGAAWSATLRLANAARKDLVQNHPVLEENQHGM